MTVLTQVEEVDVVQFERLSVSAHMTLLILWYFPHVDLHGTDVFYSGNNTSNISILLTLLG